MIDFERHPEGREGRFRQAVRLYALPAIATWVTGWYIASDRIAA
jgi:hypothetical protein